MYLLFIVQEIQCKDQDNFINISFIPWPTDTAQRPGLFMNISFIHWPRNIV